MVSGALFIAQGGVGRRFGSEGLGEFTATSISLYVVSAVASVAIPVVVSRDAASLEESDRHASASRVVGIGMTLLLCFSLVGGIALALLWDTALGAFVGRTSIAGPVIAASVVCAALGAYAGRVLQARLDIAASGLVALSQPFAVIAALGWDSFFPGVQPALMATAGYLLMGSVGAVILLSNGFGPCFDLRGAWSQFRSALPYAPLSYVNHLAGLSDRLIVSVMLGPIALGTYQAANMLVEGSLRVLKGGVSFFVAAYGRATTRSETHGERLLRMSVRLWTVYAAAAAGALIAGAEGIFRAIYGLGANALLRESGDPARTLTVLSAGLVPTVVALTFLTAGAGTGRASALTIARIAIALQIVIGVLLTSRFGVTGMATAQLITVLLVAGTHLYSSRDRSLSPSGKLGIRLIALAVMVPVVAALVSAAPILWPLRVAVGAALCGGVAAAILVGSEERWLLVQLLALKRPGTVAQH